MALEFLVRARHRPLADGRNIFGAWALGTFTNSVSDLLAFPQLVKSGALDVGVVEEQVLLRARVDEPEAPVRETLNRTF